MSNEQWSRSQVAKSVKIVKQSDQLLNDPKKHFVCEVYFCQKKYIFDPERSTNCAKSSFSVKIIYELPYFWPIIFVTYFNSFTYHVKDYKVASFDIWQIILSRISIDFFLVFWYVFSCRIQYFGPKIEKNYQFTLFCSQRSILKSKLRPKKERSIRKYGKSPNEVSFFERNITGHPAFSAKLINYQCTLGGLVCKIP